MYVIIGCGSVGFNVARMLRDRGKEILILDKSKKRVEDLRDGELNAAVCDMERLDPFRQELEQATAILLLGSNMEGNLAALKWLKGEVSEAFVVVRAIDPVSAEAFEKAGADRIVRPSEVIARSVIRELQEFEVQKAGSALANIIRGARSLAIVLHSSPDPDAMASGMALQAICEHLGTTAELYHGGKVGHQENRAFVNLLSIRLTEIGPKEDPMDYVRRHDKIALVECGVPGKNNVLPPGIVPAVVFDHHPLDEEDAVADFVDVREGVGATATILTKYLQQLNVPVSPRLATALLYAIRTDTRGFTRGATAEDMAAATFLSAYADMALLEKIETPPMAGETVDVLGRAIRNREVYGSHLLSCAEFIHDRDTLPQAADFLLQLEGVNTVLVFGIVDDVIHMSARSNDVRINLGEQMEKAFGKQNAGGHAQSAGGQIKLGIFGNVEDHDALLRLAKDAVRKQFFRIVGIEAPNVSSSANPTA
ncbi:MAG TPA: DHH family phosphoesterase [Candidatus Thermoplasmatota archaeon]|nr:DHH family phosphoesterase [Candidatus Thermoplasmatota archaeon]